MNKFLLIFGTFVFLSFARPVSASAGICNKLCQVNEECGSGYRCYVGVCRASACASSSDCSCITPTPTPVPTAAPVKVLQATPSPLPKATPIASSSGQVKKTPNTGISVPGLFAFSFALSFTGLILKGMAENP